MLDPSFNDPSGVPISAFIFGGRRSTTYPLVYEASSHEQGVFIGSILSTEKRPDQAPDPENVHYDPFAMRSYCGLDMGTYAQDWLKMCKKLGYRMPKMFCVNFFRAGSDGAPMWPGFGDNSRVIKWIFERTEDLGDVVKTPIGFVPSVASMDLKGLDLPLEAMQKLLAVDPQEWAKEVMSVRKLYDSQYGPTLPSELKQELDSLSERVKQGSAQ